MCLAACKPCGLCLPLGEIAGDRQSCIVTRPTRLELVW